MPSGNDNSKSRRDHRGKRVGPVRRFWQWWWNLWPFRRLSRTGERLYDWWFPFSESQHGYYGYGGARRENRVKWVWRRCRRLVRRSAVATALRSVRYRWYEWWHPVSEAARAYSYHGRVRRHRMVVWWRRLQRFVRQSFLARGYLALLHRLYDWWYPPSEETHAYPFYGYRRRSRLARAWSNARRRLESSWLGRKLLAVAARVYEWYFPVVEGSGGGYTRYRRLSRPGLWARSCHRWFRRTWLGRKLGWVLDELEGFLALVQARVAHQLEWRRIRKWLWRWQTGVGLGLLLAALVLGYTYGLPRCRRYLETYYARQAELYRTKGDSGRALLRARQVLDLNRDNVVAIRIFAEEADRFGSPYALQWRQQLVAVNPDPTNYVALASTALRAEAFPFSTATKALGEIKPDYRRTPLYHRTAGALAIKLSDLPAAERHFVEALRLNPDDPINRMSLAVVQLQSRNPAIIQDSRTTLELLRTDRQLGLMATRCLVAESIARSEFAQAEMLSQQILTNAQAAFSDRIVHLAILHAEKNPKLKTFLGETQKRAEEHPFYVGELAAWMGRLGMASAAREWVGGLPAQLQKSGMVPIAVADLYMALGDWKGLTGYLEKERWGEFDAVRIGMLCHASWKQGESRKNPAVWQQAVHLAARSPTMLNTLAGMAAAWGWKEEKEEVLWYAAGNYPSENWPLMALENTYTRQRDTAGLRRVFAALVKQDPKNRLAQNNYAMVSLLLGVDLVTAHKYAAELHTMEPSNPIFTSTYAFSLYLQGRQGEAVQALRVLGLDRLDDPSLAVYYGVFLAAAGEKQGAQTYLAKAAKAFLLPEEQALVEHARKSL